MPKLDFTAPSSVKIGDAFDIVLIPSGFELPDDVFEGTATSESTGTVATVTISVPVSNPLTFTLTGPGSITQDADNPARFHIVA